MVNQDILNILKEYIRKLISSGLKLSKVILYGSQARGDYNNESDIDVILVSPFFDKNRDQYIPKIWLLAADIDYRIEPYVIGEKRFNEDTISPIIQIAKRDGIEIEF